MFLQLKCVYCRLNCFRSKNYYPINVKSAETGKRDTLREYKMRCMYIGDFREIKSCCARERACGKCVARRNLNFRISERYRTREIWEREINQRKLQWVDVSLQTREGDAFDRELRSWCAPLPTVVAGRRGFISHLSLPLRATIFNPFHRAPVNLMPAPHPASIK